MGIDNMKKISELYTYEIELKDGTVITKGNEFEPSDVVRVSFIPDTTFLPRHDVIFADFKFVKRFQRTFLKPTTGIQESLHCVVTDRFRMYLFSSSGQTLITNKDYELYL